MIVKRLLLLVVAACVVVWAGILLEFSRPESRAASARRLRPVALQPVLDHPKSALQVIGDAVRSLLIAVGVQVRAEEPAKAAPPRQATGELGEGVLSPEYAELERSYVSEARDGDWARAHEE